ncbi:hypothetical protein [Yinghuangia sp. YIM S09857]|uniref:hypothetical protein n=1 Tax=Yinghuangia sp. YIM S09857 TaxID=3436929 RepID=UPI003F53956B
MQERPDNERRRIELSVAQVVASALAAVSSAFLLSELGAAGTVIGAAIASVVATVGSAVYVHVFRRTGEQLRDVRTSMGPTPLPGAPAATRTSEPDVAREQSRARIWLVRSGVAAVAVFAIAMASITVVELGMGRSFASLFGNGGGSSTIGDVTGGGGHKSTPEHPDNKELGRTPDTDKGTSRDDTGDTPSGAPQSPTPGASQSTPSGGPTEGPDPMGSPKPSTGSPEPTGGPSSGTPPTVAPPSGGAASPSAGGAQTGADRQDEATGSDAGAAQ